MRWGGVYEVSLDGGWREFKLFEVPWTDALRMVLLTSLLLCWHLFFAPSLRLVEGFPWGLAGRWTTLWQLSVVCFLMSESCSSDRLLSICRGAGREFLQTETVVDDVGLATPDAGELLGGSPEGWWRPLGKVCWNVNEPRHNSSSIMKAPGNRNRNTIHQTRHLENVYHQNWWQFICMNDTLGMTFEQFWDAIPVVIPAYSSYKSVKWSRWTLREMNEIYPQFRHWEMKLVTP